jgi:hypothetical protein
LGSENACGELSGQEYFVQLCILLLNFNKLEGLIVSR